MRSLQFSIRSSVQCCGETVGISVVLDSGLLFVVVDLVGSSQRFRWVFSGSMSKPVGNRATSSVGTMVESLRKLDESLLDAFRGFYGFCVVK